MQDEPAADELRDGGDIADSAVELPLVGCAGGTAEARTDRIDQNQVCVG